MTDHRPPTAAAAAAHTPRSRVRSTLHALVATAIVSAFASTSGHAFDARISWTPTVGAAGYNVRVRHDSTLAVFPVGPGGGGSLVSVTIPSLPLGPQIFFSVSTLNDDGDESPESNVLSLTYAAVAPIIDSDGDGLSDAEEDVDLDRHVDPGETNPDDPDTDDDGVSDGVERALGVDPLDPDTDDDGIIDSEDGCQDVDFDGHGLPGVNFTTCGPDNCPTDYNPTQLDRDADTDGDACDPCTNMDAARNLIGKSKLVLRRINSDHVAGNEGLYLKGEFALPADSAFTDLDPIAEGARLVLTSRDDVRLADQTVPGGVFPGSRGTRGWRTNSSGTVWRYRDRTVQPIGGITKIIIKDRDRRFPGGVQVVVSAAGANLPVSDGDVPVKVTVALGDTGSALLGRCGESAYEQSDCAFNRSGGTLRCPAGR